MEKARSRSQSLGKNEEKNDRSKTFPQQSQNISTQETKYFHPRDETFHKFRKGMKHFQTSKEI